MTKRNYSWDKDYQSCQLQMNLSSVLNFSGFIGFCSGVLMIPIYFFLSMSEPTTEGSLAFFTVFLSPILGFLNGVIMGFMGYPVYAYLSKKNKGQIYHGIFVGLIKSGK